MSGSLLKISTDAYITVSAGRKCVALVDPPPPPPNIPPPDVPPVVPPPAPPGEPEPSQPLVVMIYSRRELSFRFNTGTGKPGFFSNTISYYREVDTEETRKQPRGAIIFKPGTWKTENYSLNYSWSEAPVSAWAVEKPVINEPPDTFVKYIAFDPTAFSTKWYSYYESGVLKGPYKYTDAYNFGLNIQRPSHWRYDQYCDSNGAYTSAPQFPPQCENFIVTDSAVERKNCESQSNPDLCSCSVLLKAEGMYEYFKSI